jgi:hypothetical protein
VEKMKSLLRSFGDTRSTGATFGKWYGAFVS